MTAFLVVLMFAGFGLLDLAIRAGFRRRGQIQARRERAAVLETALRLDFTAEAPSLKRAEVERPQARILAVDDEPIVLDSLRKILVLAGYAVDTVESGPEALGLVQRHDYDFVFTDLKMPGMDGVEVVRAVRHLRPDVDVAVITGYGTIETAVATMQHGALDYVQKPFTEEELLGFARRLVIRRQARQEREQRPTVRVVPPAAAESAACHEYCVPGGAFVSPGHVWARIVPDGQVRIGLDDFARKALGEIEAVELPEPGAEVRRGQPLFTVRRGEARARFAAPMSGRVRQVNEALAVEPGRIAASPYERGWVCLLAPADLAGDLADLKIGAPAAAWFQAEIERLCASAECAAPHGQAGDWAAFERQFLLAERGA